MSKRYAPMGRKVDEVFAQRAAEEGARKAEIREAADKWNEVCEVLVNHSAFRTWFTKIMLDFGGMEFDRPMTEIAQGEYIMLAHLRDTLKFAPSAPAFFGEIMKKHYERLALKKEENR